ncbi:MAG: SAM-dependent methyltransferase [Pseudomonadota bacterium]
MAKASESIPASFRDPSGFLFYRDGSIYRQVNIAYKENYDHLMNSGLYKLLIDSELLIRHEEVNTEPAEPDKAYKIIKPEMITFISYPYEWSFSQLKDAALMTLEVQKRALNVGMTLKDCSAYNIQFMKGKPVFIDTLSFEKYNEGKPWVAYKQFCQHFLAPLALMRYKDIRLNQLFRIYIDGLPLDLANSLLPFHTRLRFSLLSHIHLHSKSQKYYADKSLNTSFHKMSRLSFLGLIDNLDSAIKKMKWQAQGTEWANYYENTSYSSVAIQHKKKVVTEFIDMINPKNVWDLGANVGMYSRIPSDKGIQTISFDMDPTCVEINYLTTIEKQETNILPLLLDLTNPSPEIGWENQERISILKRGPADAVLALALIHHLAISNNLPFNKIADFMNKICNSLIIEFVPKSDSKVKLLLSTREDIFSDYTQQVFEQEFKKYFTIQTSVMIKDSGRILYLMKKRQTS